ncbi:hypothetical protein [Sagittula salina]|uniref:Uncharacterized protein n=1 Tax=Sagittula salina TaxID=2820268 RepID=A0A940MQI3_9RHOB|nr:hypothetical protein [Sagittula salina]MBP0483975.1 hypothetical protein [Sagittula salina]
MTDKNRQDGRLFDGEAFVRWVLLALAELRSAKAEKCRPSHFLNEDGVRSSANRVGRMIKNPDAVTLAKAGRLEAEIREEASRVGVSLPDRLTRKDAA